jgi:hypothetical protein
MVSFGSEAGSGAGAGERVNKIREAMALPGGSSESTLAVFIQVPFAQMGDLLVKTDPALRAVRENPACLVRNIDLSKKLSTHISPQK